MYDVGPKKLEIVNIKGKKSESIEYKVGKVLLVDGPGGV